jgi:hypothetical protein
MPPKWIDLDFDDSTPAWSHVRDLKVENHWPDLIPCDIPRLEENYVRAPIMISAGPFSLFFSEEEIEDAMHDEQEPIDFIMQMGLSSYKSQHSSIIQDWNQGKELILPQLSEPLNLVLDMGKEQTGFIRFDIETEQEGVKIDILWAEKLDKSRQNLLPKCDVHEFKYGSRYFSKKGRNIHELFHWHGFRYLQVLIQPPLGISEIKNMTIMQMGVTQYHYPLPQQATFRCDDERFNQLFKSSKWTMRCCMHDGYEDCPSREQRQWVGDAYVEVLVNLALFGDTALAKKLIRQTMESQMPTGLTEMTTPGDHEIHGLFIPDYTLYWTLTVYEIYWYTGDQTLLHEYMPSMIKATDWFLKYVNKIGLLSDHPYWIFIDWSINDKWGANSTINAQLIYTLEKMIEMAEIVGYHSVVPRYRTVREKMLKAFDEYFWNPSRGAYCDAVMVDEHDKIVKHSQKITMHANALAILYDIAPPERIGNISQRVFEIPFDRYYLQNFDPIWKGVTAEKYNEAEHIVMAQPFFMFHVHQALAKMGHYGRMREFIEKGWCKMIELGASTLWEHWGDAASACHAWSTTPAHDMVRHIFGVQITSPGATQLTVAPQLFGLMKANGRVPTPKGWLEIAWQYDSNKKVLTISHSTIEGVEIKIKPPIIESAEPIECIPKTDGTKMEYIYRYLASCGQI